jgi:uncharacterized protein (TIGR02611 family)
MTDQPETTRDRLKGAAFEAEYATGDRERTRQGARRNIIVRLTIITVGTIITLLGLAALVLPGPGLVLVLIGLGILAQEVSWAERLLAYTRRKAKLDKVKTQPLWVRIALWVFTILGVTAGIAFTVYTMSD